MNGHPLMPLTEGVNERQKSLAVALRLPVQWVGGEDVHHGVSLPELLINDWLKTYERVCENHWQVEKVHSGRCFCASNPCFLTKGVLGKDWSTFTPLSSSHLPWYCGRNP